jgi:hypothetical protein
MCSLNVSTECSLIVHWMCPLNVHWMFTDCSQNVHWMFTEYSLKLHWMFPECSLKVHCSTPSSTPGIRRLVLLTLVLGTHVCKLYSASTLVLFFLKCFWQLGWRLTGVRSTLPECSLNVHWKCTECSLNVFSSGGLLPRGGDVFGESAAVG